MDVAARHGNFVAVEFARFEWLAWFNKRRLLEPHGDSPPAEAEKRSCSNRRDYRRAQHAKAPPDGPCGALRMIIGFYLVAGAGFEPAAFRL